MSIQSKFIKYKTTYYFQVLNDKQVLIGFLSGNNKIITGKITKTKLKLASEQKTLL